MKIIIIGYGSMGRRHARNIRALYPDCHLIITDPLSEIVREPSSVFYRDWETALEHHSDADGVVIASPFQFHLEQMTAVSRESIPFYCEKPLGGRNQKYDDYRIIKNTRNAIGFQYRYHPSAKKLANYGVMRFEAQDDLAERYGATAAETMASHTIDLALWRLGKAKDVKIKQDDGFRFECVIEHEYGVSRHALVINRSPRKSVVFSNAKEIELFTNDEMYIGAMSAWINLISGGKHDGKLATFDDGVAVMDVLNSGRVIA